MGKMQTCIYGPVPSRRLGRSLGIDLLPAKICSYDCIYCQLGRTTATTIKRRPYRKAVEVLDQLEQALDRGVTADCVTIAGSGEPTLNSEIGTVIQGIKARTSLPVAVLTNGSMLSEKAVREALAQADIVIPSLDAHNKPLFEAVNRPHADIKFDRMFAGLVEFSQIFHGRLWLEILIMDGINASPDDAARFKPLVDKIRPTDIYVNTTVRPAPEAFARQADEGMIDHFYETLGCRRQRDTVFSITAEGAGRGIAPAILEMVARRPVTAEDMAKGLGVPVADIRERVEKLVSEKRLEAVQKNAATYYRAFSSHDKA